MANDFKNNPSAGAIMPNTQKGRQWVQSSRGPDYATPEQRPLTPSDHFRGDSVYSNSNVKSNDPIVIRKNDSGKFIKNVSDHFTSNGDAYNGGQLNGGVADSFSSYLDKDTGERVLDFRGSATLVNPYNDSDRNLVSGGGFGLLTDKDDDGYIETPVSPLNPILRTPNTINYYYYSRLADVYSYNRFKFPIVDNEFRKGYHSTFISRPECYICCTEGGLSEQCASDPVFAASYNRLPHVSELLSPYYVNKTYIGDIQHNWNFLLSNRIISVNAAPESSIETVESSKTVEGYHVKLGTYRTSNLGGEIQITFRETRNLEVFECLRLWMEYINKRYKGVFSPSYNGYQRHNDFSVQPSCSEGFKAFQVYDRALDYCASLFDVFTNESMSKILFWSKWYGLFPKSASVEGMNIDNGASTIQSEGLKVTATFVYMCKEDCNITNLVEFNYNSGFTNDVGAYIKYNFNTSPSYVNTWEYAGAVGFFTGPPYITMVRSAGMSRGSLRQVVSPMLRFADLHSIDPNANTIDSVMNMGMTGLNYYNRTRIEDRDNTSIKPYIPATF